MGYGSYRGSQKSVANYVTAGGAHRYPTGILQVSYMNPTGITQVLHRYYTGITQVLHRNPRLHNI